MIAAGRHKHYEQQILSLETCQGDWEMKMVWEMLDLDLNEMKKTKKATGYTFVRQKEII